jgi:UDP-2,3-diacylglucosamine hydrolase
MSVVGLIAGSGTFPLRFAESARASGHRVIAAAHVGETDRSIESLADEVTWVHVGQFGKIVKAFRAAGVTEAAMAGGITKVRVFGGLRPDLLALKYAAKVSSWNDDGLLRFIAGMFESEGIRIIDSTRYCPDIFGREGLYTNKGLDDAQRRDVDLGLQVARALGAVDVGQTVCVKGGSVVAVEAVEGTDRCLARAGELAGKGVVVVKTAKPQQDMRFDVPCIGPDTIDVCRKIGAAVVAIEAGRTLVLDEDETVRRAEKAGIVLVGVR